MKAKLGKRDAMKRKLGEQEALDKEEESEATRPPHSLQMVDPVFHEPYNMDEKINPQEARVRRVRRQGQKGSIFRARTPVGYISPSGAPWWTRGVSRRALGPHVSEAGQAPRHGQSALSRSSPPVHAATAAPDAHLRTGAML